MRLFAMPLISQWHRRMHHAQTHSIQSPFKPARATVLTSGGMVITTACHAEDPGSIPGLDLDYKVPYNVVLKPIISL